jgi:hypothetical protein
MGKAARNEEKKLAAGWFNSVSAATISVGVLGPLVARLLGALTVPLDPFVIIFLSVVCLGSSAILHFVGRAKLKELED